jgi:vacuolar-type H+-ATPase subunit E/Vma4
MSRAEASDAALEPMRVALLAQARADAAAILDRARAQARTEREHAESEAAAITECAAAAGRARAAGQLAARQRAAAAAGRAQLLAAQCAAYDRWRAESTDAVLGLHAEPGYARIRDGLRAMAVRLLGPDAVIVDDPDGGVVAQGDGRMLDLRLRTIAARALDRVEPEIGELWA